MKNLFFIGVFFLFSCMSCKKDESEKAMNLSASLFITYEDTEGHDLLDTAHTKGITYENVKIFDMINGKKKLRINAHLHNPKLIIFSYGDLFKTGKDFGIMEISLNTYAEKDGISTTIIEYKGFEPDTIRAQVKIGRDYVNTGDIWVNGQLVSVDHPRLNPYYTLVK